MGDGMVSKEITIINPGGLHLRPAGELCRCAMNYQSSVTFKIGHTTANAKSVLSVLAAGVKHGDRIELCCDGTDEVDALKELSLLIEDGLGEK
jgi:phosphocarrier protein